VFVLLPSTRVPVKKRLPHKMQQSVIRISPMALLVSSFNNYCCLFYTLKYTLLDFKYYTMIFKNYRMLNYKKHVYVGA